MNTTPSNTPAKLGRCACGSIASRRKQRHWCCERCAALETVGSARRQWKTGRTRQGRGWAEHEGTGR